jgi:rubrerythrin
MPISDIIHLAAKREEKAYKLYLELAAKCDDAKLKKLFDVLATEELKHKNRFETMYDEIVLSEN